MISFPLSLTFELSFNSDYLIKLSGRLNKLIANFIDILPLGKQVIRDPLGGILDNILHLDLNVGTLLVDAFEDLESLYDDAQMAGLLYCLLCHVEYHVHLLLVICYILYLVKLLTQYLQFLIEFLGFGEQ